MDVHAFSIPASMRFRRHAHDGMHLCAVLDGGFAERDGKGSVELSAGDVRLSPACRHDIDFGPAGARCVLIELEPATVEPLRRSLFVADQPRLGGLVRALGRAQTGLNGRDETLRALRVEAAATELMAQLERLRDGRPLPPPPWLERVRDYLHDAAETPSVTELARIAGVHRVHLARAFRDHFGVSVSAYGRRLRLERAVRLLRAGDLPLASVAADAGFADQSHLTRTLRQTLGVTPARLRRG